jgi:hypothetical protein
MIFDRRPQRVTADNGHYRQVVIIEITASRASWWTCCALSEISMLKSQRLKQATISSKGSSLSSVRTAVDFANSILDGRIFLQADRMAESGLPAFLLIEGNVYTQTNLTIVSLTGALSWLGVQGIRIIPTLSPRHTAHMIAKLTRMCRRDWVT